ncbi:DUF4383 domain-containing protein [Rhodococcus aetherivorans]|uniref:DUF4383 domain-containing protein n=1 Tax=Rhodococcus aetherivorans TaxID=191292 RepID=UPI000622D035|nr:DUF4383 domain-containing protein [Rhodococcus aetherivorans]AKE91105.1 membrane protein [Rhodococcus aetherivorans]WFS15491.1 DUF4383 domain-containing protein [Rhodococcus aetherivorans]
MTEPLEPAQRAGQPESTRSIVQLGALSAGTLFLVVGIAGFVPGVTGNYDELAFGHESGALLLGVFAVSVLHNVVHLVFGLAGVVAARRAALARWYLIVGGLVYLALFLYGLIVRPEGSANVLPVNDADNWLHLGVAVTMLGLGLAAPRIRPATTV